MTRSTLRRAASAALAPLAVLAVTTVAAAPAYADGPGVGTPYVATVGDSYISGEAGRWAGNTNNGSSLIDALGSTAYFDNPARTAEQISRCHRSWAASAHIGGGVGGVVLACSGAKTGTFTDSSGSFKPGLDFYDNGAGNRGQAALLQGREVEIGEAHRALQLPGAVAGQEDDRGMGDDRLDRGPAMARRIGQHPADLRLFRRVARFGQCRAGPGQQFGQADEHPRAFCCGEAGFAVRQAGVNAAQHFGLRRRLHVVQRLGVLHEVVRQVFAQFVALAHYVGALAQPATRVGVERDEARRDEDLVVVFLHGQCLGVSRA